MTVRAEGTARLAYGPLPQGELKLEDGHRAVTFVACPADEAMSTATGPVTFWSGFILTPAPACVQFEIHVEDERSAWHAVVPVGPAPC